MRLVTTILFVILLGLPGPLRAGPGPVVALFDIEDKGSGLPAQELSKLTDFLGARLAEGGYRMVPREEVQKRLAGQKRESHRACYERSCQIELGRELAAQKSLAVRVLGIGQTCQITAEMFDLEQSTTYLAATEEATCSIPDLLKAMRRISDKLCQPLGPETSRSTGISKKLPRRRTRPKKKVSRDRISVGSQPKGATVMLNGRKKCHATPCTIDVVAGEHELSMKAARHKVRAERIKLQSGKNIHWKLEPQEYSYLGMQSASAIADLIMVGIDPGDTGYLVFSIIEGASYYSMHPLVDVGMAVESFVWRHTPKGSRWAMINFGPAFRVGRLVVKSYLHLLSFAGSDWAPGFSARVSIPLASQEEAGDIAFVIPMPTVGVDVLLNDSLGLDQTHFWVGIGWIGNVTFE